MVFTDMKDKAIPQPDPIASMQPQFVKNFQQYDLSNPHPGFGKDPNILNEYGHTLYPKWVEKPNGERVIVENKEQEDEALGVDPEHLRDDGPTLTDYVSAGYDPKTYPPKGFASKHKPEEIEEFIKKHHKTGW